MSTKKQQLHQQRNDKALLLQRMQNKNKNISLPTNSNAQLSKNVSLPPIVPPQLTKVVGNVVKGAFMLVALLMFAIIYPIESLIFKNLELPWKLLIDLIICSGIVLWMSFYYKKNTEKVTSIAMVILQERSQKKL